MRALSPLGGLLTLSFADQVGLLLMVLLAAALLAIFWRPKR